MPGQFLTLAEREQLSSFPPSPTEDDIITFFALDQKEIALVKRRSGDLNGYKCSFSRNNGNF